MHVCIGLGQAVKRAPLNAATAAVVGKAVPYCAGDEYIL